MREKLQAPVTISIPVTVSHSADRYLSINMGAINFSTLCFWQSRKGAASQIELREKCLVVKDLARSETLEASQAGSPCGFAHLRRASIGP
ncbi:hypothetical protein E6O75_ATG04522 [Venturia nashicola]|uniref:Uncharacterized protein n=1 Tax=Venturia nashicola TaxID=86259 RepID=A0A4Z1P865_9PEZI|nr:hypothetical protein E6O75_ATG04522 [Venturia nashicola]